MKVVVIGGSGHIGTYLIPMLVEQGHTVTNVSRGQREAYLPNIAWKQVTHVQADRDAEDKDSTFAKRILGLKPDIVVDLICFTEQSNQQMVEALRGNVQHFLHCGTVWVQGHSTVVPMTEDQPLHPFGEYGTQKAAIEGYLLTEARQRNFPATVLRPGHIVGPGYSPLNPVGHFNPQVFAQIARGEPLTLPNLGLETVHHVHARDVAHSFMQSITHWSASVGEAFNVVSPTAITLRGYAEAMYAWFGKTPELKYLPWDTWRTTVTESEANATWDHIAHSPNASIAKARQLIGYQPAYTSLQAVQEAVSWLFDHAAITV